MVSISGRTKIQAKKGILEFSGLKFTGNPNHETVVTVSCSGIDPEKYQLVTGNQYQCKIYRP